MFEEHVMKDSCDSTSQTATPEPVTCPECHETFSGRRYFMQHYRAIHGGLPPNCQGEFLYILSLDGAPFVSFETAKLLYQTLK